MLNGLRLIDKLGVLLAEALNSRMLTQQHDQ